MSWFLAPQNGTEMGLVAGARVGLTAGKVLGKAHERNRIKRRMREALRRHVELLPAGCDLILHPRRNVLTIDFGKLEAEIVRILHQAQAETAQADEAKPHHGKPGLTRAQDVGRDKACEHYDTITGWDWCCLQEFSASIVAAGFTFRRCILLGPGAP